MTKLIIVHKNTDKTELKIPSSNELITWIVLEKESGEKVLFFPQDRDYPVPCNHVIKMAITHDIADEDITWIDIEEFDKMFNDGKFTEGPHRQTFTNDSRVPYFFNAGCRPQVWGMVGDKLYYSAYKSKEDKP